jgi:hypothetical protein
VEDSEVLQNHPQVVWHGTEAEGLEGTVGVASFGCHCQAFGEVGYFEVAVVSGMEADSNSGFHANRETRDVDYAVGMLDR